MGSPDIVAWIWVQDEKLIKAIYHKKRKTLIIFDENDEILLKREGVKEDHIKKIETLFLNCGAQRLDSS